MTDFAYKFDAKCVEMKDFTIRIDDLPKSFEQYNDEINMKYAIWRHIQEKIADLSNSGIPSIPSDLDPSIVEINFGLKSYENLIMIKNIENTN